MDLVDELAKMLVNAMKVKLKDLSLSDITEDALRLWKLHSPWPIESGDRDIPNIDELLESFSGDEASMAEKLHPLEFLSSYFNQSPPARHLHVIVEAAISSRSEFSSLSPLNISVKRCCGAQCLMCARLTLSRLIDMRWSLCERDSGIFLPNVMLVKIA